MADWLKEYMRMRKRAKDIESFADAEAYAEEIGLACTNVVKKIGLEAFADMVEADVVELLKPILKKAFDDATSAAVSAHLLQLARLGLGLGALRPEYDQSAAQTVAEQFAGKVLTEDYVLNVLTQHTLSAVDKTISKNAAANAEMGLETRITRKYSGIGIRRGTKHAEDCAWCKSRCGKWDDYDEAIAAGCFERHPGCRCIVDYKVGRTHTVATGMNGWTQV